MAKKRKAKRKYWSHRVTEQSDALTLEPGVFTKPSAKAVAKSLKRSADRSGRRKSPAYRSAMSMLTFHINRAGRSLPASRKRKLEGAKDELRTLYGKGQKSRSKARAKAKRKTRRRTARKKRN